MIKFSELIRTQTYIELDAEDGGKMFMPASATIFVDDNSNAISVKTTGSRKTIGYVISGGTPPVPPVPPEPTYSGFCKLTLNDGSVVELEGEGELTSAMTEQYWDTAVELVTGNKCTALGKECFYGGRGVATTALTSVTLSDTVETLGEQAFNACTGIKTFIIGTGIKTIGEFAITYLISLESLTIKAVTPPTKEYGNIHTSCPIYVPSQSVDAYKTATNWSSYADRIQAIP